MNKRRLGNTPLQLTEIGFGAWAIGGADWQFGWGPQNDDEAVAAIRRALDLGVNWIDTAAVYGLGHSEQVVAKAIAGRRHDVIVATKCSLIWDEARSISSSLARESVRRECEASLRRLDTDVIDLYQIHWPNDDGRIEEGWEEIGRLIKEGKVRCGGVSNFLVSHMQRAAKLHPIASLQPRYNLIHREVEQELLPYCADNHIGVVVYSPMASGLLSGRFSLERVAENDWRRRAEEFRPPALQANLAFVDALRPIASAHQKTVGQLAIAWTLRRSEVTSAIVGARTPAQVDEIVGGADWKLSAADIAEIDRLWQVRLDHDRDGPARFR